jgi:hypothetical protein
MKIDDKSGFTVSLEGEALNTQKHFPWDFQDLSGWVKFDRCLEKGIVPSTTLGVPGTDPNLEGSPCPRGCGIYIRSVSAFETRKGSILPADLGGQICSRDWLGYWRVDFDDFIAHIADNELDKFKQDDFWRLPPTIPGGYSGFGFKDRSGSGNARDQAFADKRSIKGVVWYTRQLEDGIAGNVGILHSLLAVSCSGGQEPDYVLERANAKQNCGVFVSDWMEVKQGGKTLSQYCALPRETVKNQMTMSELITIAVDMGPYDVMKCNCDHTAMRVYNSCASTPMSMMTKMPNSGWLAVANTIGAWISLDFFQSEASRKTRSGESTSKSAEASRRVGAAASEAAYRQINLELKDER